MRVQLKNWFMSQGRTACGQEVKPGYIEWVDFKGNRIWFADPVPHPPRLKRWTENAKAFLAQHWLVVTIAILPVILDKLILRWFF